MIKNFKLSLPLQIYLRKWATKLNGIPILSVDYQLKSAYPQAIQDVLDVYLRLFTVRTTNDTRRTDNRFEQTDEINQAEKLFGFVPKNVLLVGDSCGGNLQLSLLCCLNDIRRREASRPFVMPFAFTAIYPVFDLRAVCSSSKFIGSIDPILTNGNVSMLHTLPVTTLFANHQNVFLSVLSAANGHARLLWIPKPRCRTLQFNRYVCFCLNDHLTNPVLNGPLLINTHILLYCLCKFVSVCGPFLDNGNFR